MNNAPFPILGCANCGRTHDRNKRAGTACIVKCRGCGLPRCSVCDPDRHTRYRRAGLCPNCAGRRMATIPVYQGRN